MWVYYPCFYIVIYVIYVTYLGKNISFLFYHPFCLKTSTNINSFFIFFADDCPNCVDEHSGSLAASRWTMPLLKLGEKRYYLGIFFKVSLLPVTLIYLAEPSTQLPFSLFPFRTLSNYFRARNFPALPSRTVLRCIECQGTSLVKVFRITVTLCWLRYRKEACVIREREWNT